MDPIGTESLKMPRSSLQFARKEVLLRWALDQGVAVIPGTNSAFWQAIFVTETYGNLPRWQWVVFREKTWEQVCEHYKFDSGNFFPKSTEFEKKKTLSSHRWTWHQYRNISPRKNEHVTICHLKSNHWFSGDVVSFFWGVIFQNRYVISSCKVCVTCVWKLAGMPVHLFWSCQLASGIFDKKVWCVPWPYAQTKTNGWNLRIWAPWKRTIIFQTIIFRFYVNLRGCSWECFGKSSCCPTFLSQLWTSIEYSLIPRVRDFPEALQGPLFIP